MNDAGVREDSVSLWRKKKLGKKAQSRPNQTPAEEKEKRKRKIKEKKKKKVCRLMARLRTGAADTAHKKRKRKKALQPAPHLHRISRRPPVPA